MKKLFNSSLRNLVFFAQTSLREFQLFGIIALVLSLLILPLWYQVFSFKNIPVEVSLTAPNAQEIKIYWDNPQRFPNAYEKIIPNSVNSELWNITIEPLAEKNPQSQGYEIHITDLNTPPNKVDWNQLFSQVKTTEWQLTDFQWSSQGKSLLWKNRDSVGSPIKTQIEGGNLQINFQKNPYSGKVKVTANGQSQILDLYRDRAYNATSAIFPAISLGNQSPQSFSLKIPHTLWRKLQFFSDNGQPVTIEKLSVNRQNIPNVSSSSITLPFFPFQFWLHLILTLMATLVSWIWFTLLLVSASHIWQGQTQKRLGVISYIVLFSIAVSVVWLLVLYPGAVTPDTMAQWEQAKRNKYYPWHPPFFALLMRLTQYFVNQPNLLALIQGSLFWGAIFYLLYQVTQNRKIFLVGSSLLTLVPPLWLYTSTLVSNTWMTTFALFSAAFLIRAKDKQRRNSFILSIICLSIAAMFRREVVLLFIVPAFMYFFVYWKQQKLYQKLLIFCIIPILVILPSRIILYLPVIHSGLDFPFEQLLLHQYVGTITYSTYQMSPSKIASEKSEIDQALEAGTFQRLFDHYTCYSENYVRIYQPRESSLLRDRLTDDQSQFITQKYIQTLLNYPGGFLKHKMCNFAYVLQIPNIQYEGWTLLENWPDMEAYLTRLGIQPDSKLPSVKQWYRETLLLSFAHPLLSLLYKHYIWLAFSVLIGLVGLMAKNEKLVILALFALVYASAHLISDSYGHWRYLLLSYVFALITLIAAIDQFLTVRKKPLR